MAGGAELEQLSHELEGEGGAAAELSAVLSEDAAAGGATDLPATESDAR